MIFYFLLDLCFDLSKNEKQHFFFTLVNNSLFFIEGFLLFRCSEIMEKEKRQVNREIYGYKNDEDYLRGFAESLGVRLHLFETEFDETTDERRTHCFLCSWHRRKVLFDAAQRLGCNKIALGHHRDDLMETALMNLTFEGKFHTMPPRLRMEKFPVEIIRPLCLLREKDMQAFADLRGYRQQAVKCPYEEASHRADMKEMISRFEALNPEFAYTFFTAIERTFPE